MTPEPTTEHLRRGLRLAVWCCLATLLPVAPAGALSSDKDQPIEVEADYAELDDLAGRTVYRGNVVVVQGSIRLTGDVLTIHYTAERDMKEVYVDGRPARFRQRPDGKEQDIEGESLRIEYYVLQDLVHLREKARLTEAGKLFSGHEIVYDTARSLVTARKADGPAPKAGEAGGAPRERVKVILPPRRKAPPP